jgi:hypothetical protein
MCRYCGFQTGEQMSPRIEHSVKLVHWALMDKEVTCGMDVDIYEYGCWSRLSLEVRPSAIFNLPKGVPPPFPAIPVGLDSFACEAGALDTDV